MNNKTRVLLFELHNSIPRKLTNSAPFFVQNVTAGHRKTCSRDRRRKDAAKDDWYNLVENNGSRFANRPSGRGRRWLCLEELPQDVRNVYCERNLSARKTGIKAESLFHSGPERPSAPRRGGCDAGARWLFARGHTP